MESLDDFGQKLCGYTILNRKEFWENKIQDGKKECFEQKLSYPQL